MATVLDARQGEQDVPALQKGLRVLDVIAQHDGLTAAEIERSTGLNKAMVFRLLRALRLNGYVELNEATRGYSLGTRLIEIGAIASARIDVVGASREIIERLRDSLQETVNLGILRDGQVVYAAMAESPRSLRMISAVGRRDSLHSTSIGKAILAWLPPPERRALLTMHSLDAHTAHTITDLSVIEANLEAARDRGYAIDDQENEPGARCLGVPILDNHNRPIAGLSVSGPSTRMEPDRFATIAAQLWQASSEVSRRLGHIDAHGPQR